MDEDVTQNKLFTAENASIIAKRIENNLKVPYVVASVSTLGGKENVAIIIKISLDEKSTWSNGIYLNSKYMMFRLSNNGILERFQSHYTIPTKFRKKIITSLELLFTILNKHFQEASSKKVTEDYKEEIEFKEMAGDWFWKLTGGAPDESGGPFDTREEAEKDAEEFLGTTEKR